MSSQRNDNLVEKALAEGACYFLEKPICLEDLKFVWQHVYRKRVMNLKKESRKVNCEEEMNHGNESGSVKILEIDDLSRAFAKGNIIGETGGVCRHCSEVIKIKEVDDVIRPSNEGNKFKEAGGVSGSNTVRYLDDFNNKHTDPKGNEKKQFSLRNENHTKELQNCCREGSKTKRLRDDEEQQQREKRTKINSESKSSEGKKVDKEDGERNNDSNSSADKRARITWTPELHLKFTAAVSTLGDKGNFIF